MTREFIYNGQSLRFEYEPNGTAKLKLDSGEHEATCEELSPGTLILQNSHGRRRARVVRQKDRIFVWLGGRSYEFHIPSPDEYGGHGGIVSPDVRAPMPGTLIKVFVKEGDAVEADQVVAVLEAMKMEHQLRAPFSGTVTSVNGEIGVVVEADAVIVALQPAE